MIHTIGDSNALTPWKDMKDVSVNWMGPVLVHSVGVKKLNMVDTFCKDMLFPNIE